MSSVYCHTLNNFSVFIIHAMVSILLKVLPQCNDSVEGVLIHNLSTSTSSYLFSHSYWVKLLNGPHKYLPVNIIPIGLKAKKIRLKAGQVDACLSITFPLYFEATPPCHWKFLILNLPRTSGEWDPKATQDSENIAPQFAGSVGHYMRTLKRVQCVLDLLVSLCPNGIKIKKGSLKLVSVHSSH